MLVTSPKTRWKVTSSICRIGRISRKENKLVRWAVNITGEFDWTIPRTCWDRFTSPVASCDDCVSIVRKSDSPIANLILTLSLTLVLTSYVADLRTIEQPPLRHTREFACTIKLFFGVYIPKFTKFSTLVKHLGDCLPWKFDGELQQYLLCWAQQHDRPWLAAYCRNSLSSYDRSLC